MGRNTGERYRRSPYLVSYWVDSHLVFANYATARFLTADAFTTEVLDFFDRWRSVAALEQRFPEFTPASLRRTVRTLTQHTLLQEASQGRQANERAMAWWDTWNPAAGFFHFATKDIPYELDLEAVERDLERQVRESPPPPAVKHYPRAPQIALPAPRRQDEFPQVLLGRRTWRRFSRAPLRLSELATLLGLTWGVQHWVRSTGDTRAVLKTSPSAGALHPLEVYVAALRVAGLPRGLYHYAADRHRLERLRRGVGAGTAVKYLAGQWWFRDAAAVMLMTAVFPRNQWKYQHARAYRTVLLDAGHLCQTFLLTATWLGLAPFCTMALADSRIERDLGLDGVSESVLYAAGVGVRPAGVEWAPWPGSRRR